MKYIIGTRGSKLALAQAEYVRGSLRQVYPEDEFEIQVIKTKGDLIWDKPLNEIGDKGLFVREIEEKLLAREIDIGVHSMKDMPSLPAPGLMFAKAWKREDPRDVLVLRNKKSLKELPQGAVIGTGSRRRECQIKSIRPDICVTGIRGNVESRLRKMEEQKLDGLILAAAGLKRLGLGNSITQYLKPEEMIPAPAQGILALEIRQGEDDLLAKMNMLSDRETEEAARAERGFLEEIGGDCHVPVGAVYTKREDGSGELRAMFGNFRGKWASAVVRGDNPGELARKAAFLIRQQLSGIVQLVGAGPGDPGLITVKGLKALREADCIVYDRLSSPELLKEAKIGCDMIYVGKASHRHTMEQEEIHRLLVRKSLEYEKTVRLQGGDVYVFGRGGEEGLFLREKGVDFEVIPGISSCIAGPAMAGIPITHRGMAPGFHVVTAHNKSDRLADIDFEGMARGKETCVFLMGLGRVGEIAKKLMEAGMPEDTGAAVISQATTPSQRCCVSDLLHIEAQVKQSELPSPAVIVVGDVVSLRGELNFFEKRPLFGKRYLIPKIGEKPARLGEMLSGLGARVDEILAGVVKSREVPFTQEQLKAVDWLVFTSKNGVEAFFENLRRNGLDMRHLAGCRIAVIGKNTGEALEKHGLSADLIPDHFNSDVFGDALVQQIKEQISVPVCESKEMGRTVSGGKRKKVWYLKAANAINSLKDVCGEYCDFEEIDIYENCPVEIDLKRMGELSEYDGIFFTSASMAERFLAAVKEGLKECGKIYSIGPKTTSCLMSFGAEHVLTAERSDYEGLVELCLKTP